MILMYVGLKMPLGLPTVTLPQMMRATGLKSG